VDSVVLTVAAATMAAAVPERLATPAVDMATCPVSFPLMMFDSCSCLHFLRRVRQWHEVLQLRRVWPLLTRLP
jgi:hypothetical protein